MRLAFLTTLYLEAIFPEESAMGKRPRHANLICMAACAMIAVHGASATAATLDEFNVATAPAGATDPTSQTIGNSVFNPTLGHGVDLGGIQTVTTGITGQLTQVDLQLAQILSNGVPTPSGSGELAIVKNITFDQSGFISGGTLLADTDFSTSAINGFNSWTSIDLSGFGINLQAGDQFALLVSGANQQTNAFRWAFSGNNYAGGIGYVGVDSTGTGAEKAWSASGNNFPRDYGFRTFVQTGVPEPGTWLLTIIGFGFIGIAMRRRQRLQQETLPG